MKLFEIIYKPFEIIYSLYRRVREFWSFIPYWVIIIFIIVSPPIIEVVSAYNNRGSIIELYNIEVEDISIISLSKLPRDTTKIYKGIGKEYLKPCIMEKSDKQYENFLDWIEEQKVYEYHYLLGDKHEESKYKIILCINQESEIWIYPSQDGKQFSVYSKKSEVKKYYLTEKKFNIDDILAFFPEAYWPETW